MTEDTPEVPPIDDEPLRWLGRTALHGAEVEVEELE